MESIASESQYTNLTNQLDGTLSQLQARVIDILQRVGPQMQETLKKTMFHVAWSPDTLPTNQAVCPLFDYLYTNLQALNLSLLPQNFQRILFEVYLCVTKSFQFFNRLIYFCRFGNTRWSS